MSFRLLFSDAGPWVPVRPLSARHRAKLMGHLKALPEHDRYLRFGQSASDEHLARYVAGIDFTRDHLYGIFDRRLALIATSHLAILPAQAGQPAFAEFGVSVLPTARRKGYGRLLFGHAARSAQVMGVERLIIHALTENRSMLGIARHAGATVERHGSEAEAHLKLPAVGLGTALAHRLNDRAAELDYRMKRQACRWRRLSHFIASLKSALGRPGVASS